MWNISHLFCLFTANFICNTGFFCISRTGFRIVSGFGGIPLQTTLFYFAPKIWVWGLVVADTDLAESIYTPHCQKKLWVYLSSIRAIFSLFR